MPYESSQAAVQALRQSAMLDEWPDYHLVGGFGIESQKHLEALYEGLKSGELDDEQIGSCYENPALLNEVLLQVRFFNENPSLVPTFT